MAMHDSVKKQNSRPIEDGALDTSTYYVRAVNKFLFGLIAHCGILNSLLKIPKVNRIEVPRPVRKIADLKCV